MSKTKEKPAPETVAHEAWHRACRQCAGTDGYYPTTARHDECSGKCGGEYRNTKCAGPCPCTCSTPLSRDEVMEVRDLIERLRRR